MQMLPIVWSGLGGARMGAGLNVSQCQPLTGHGHGLANARDGHKQQGHTHA